MKRSSLFLLTILALVAIAWGLTSLLQVPEQISNSPVHTAMNKQWYASAHNHAGAIEGRIVAGSGQGISDAQVCALLRNASENSFTCVRSTNTGAFAMGKLEPGLYTVSAAAEGFSPAEYPNERLQLGIGATLADIQITLVATGCTLQGVVKDIGGGIVIGAQVVARVATGASVVTESEEDGRFSLALTSGPVRVTARASGYAPTVVDAQAPGTHLELVLKPESVLQGRVFDRKRNEGIASAVVEVYREKDWKAWRAGAHAVATVRSSATGHYEITSLEPGRYKPHARAPGYYGEHPKSVQLGFAERAIGIDIPMQSVAMIRAYIRETGSETPQTSCAVHLDDEERDYHLHAVSNESGEVTFPAVVLGEYVASIDCPNHHLSERPGLVLVGEEHQFNIVWHVRRGGTLKGMVVTADDEPISGASVDIFPLTRERSSTQTRRATSTDPQGHFVVYGLAPSSYGVAVVAFGFIASVPPMQVKIGSGTNDDIRIVMGAGGVVEGKVIDHEGRHVANVHVRAEAAGGRAKHDARSGEEGRFSIKGLAPGTYSVFPVFDEVPLQSAERKVTIGQKGVAEVELVVQRPDHVIVGKVTNNTNHGLPDVYVTAIRSTPTSRHIPSATKNRGRWSFSRKLVLTGANGEFQLSDLAAGTYTLWAYKKGGGEAFLENVRPNPEDAVTIVMQQAGSISGTALFSNGDPVDVFSVQVVQRDTGFERIERFFGSDGQWEVAEIPAGKTRLTAWAPEGNGTTHVNISRGEVLEGVELVIQPSAKVRGVVVDIDTNTPIANVVLLPQPLEKPMIKLKLEGDPEGKNISGPDGAFELTRVPVGRVRILGFPQDASAYHASGEVITLESAAEASVIIRLVKRRRSFEQLHGDLGFKLIEFPMDVPDDYPLEVASVDPHGSAAKSGLHVGDVIISVNGHERLGGPFLSIYSGLIDVAANTELTLGLKRGKKVSVVTQ